jgi:hypothetical protein
MLTVNWRKSNAVPTAAIQIRKTVGDNLNNLAAGPNIGIKNEEKTPKPHKTSQPVVYRKLIRPFRENRMTNRPKTMQPTANSSLCTSSWLTALF